MTEGFMHRAASTRPAWMELDLGALKDNYEVIRRRVGPWTKVFAVIKANAYGHGAVEVARTLRDVGVYALALGSIAEALTIRRAEIDTKILIYGSTPPEAASELFAHDLVPTVDTPAAAQAVAAATRSPAPILRRLGQSSQTRPIKIFPQRDLSSHGEPPNPFTTLIKAFNCLGTP